MAEVFSVIPRRWRGIGDIPDERPRPRATPTPPSTPSSASARVGASDEDGRRMHRAAWCCAASASRPSARPSARAARPSIRSASPWCRPRAPARPTTAIAGRTGAREPRSERLELSLARAERAQRPIQLAHGGGGRVDGAADRRGLPPRLRRPAARPRATTARARPSSGPVAFTTDSYVVRPLFFPGGDIGTLAVNGTVNDLAMCGARPLYLSVGLILEEGLPLATLRRVVASMRAAGRRGGRAAGHRRHQGGRPRQGRRHVHQHRRHRSGRRAAGPIGPAGVAARRRRDAQRRHRAATASP